MKSQRLIKMFEGGGYCVSEYLPQMEGAYKDKDGIKFHCEFIKRHGLKSRVEFKDFIVDKLIPSLKEEKQDIFMGLAENFKKEFIAENPDVKIGISEVKHIISIVLPSEYGKCHVYLEFDDYIPTIVDVETVSCIAEYYRVNKIVEKVKKKFIYWSDFIAKYCGVVPPTKHTDNGKLIQYLTWLRGINYKEIKVSYFDWLCNDHFQDGKIYTCLLKPFKRKVVITKMDNSLVYWYTENCVRKQRKLEIGTTDCYYFLSELSLKMDDIKETK